MHNKTVLTERSVADVDHPKNKGVCGFSAVQRPAVALDRLYGVNRNTVRAQVERFSEVDTGEFRIRVSAVHDDVVLRAAI